MTDRVPPRVLRSKRLRAALFIAAEGKCERCGQELDSDWEADHVVAWSIARRTNIHELRATCRACNRQKGSMSYRTFQIATQRAAQDIVTGDPRRKIVVDAYPGSGKSAIPVILTCEFVGKVIDGRRIDHVCWVVPRLTLQEQAMDAYLSAMWRRELKHEYRIRQSTNDVRPSRNLAGHTTTYQAIASNNQLLIDEFSRKNYLLILDEPHHVVEGGEYDLALRPLVDLACITVLQSGTLYRASRHEAIAFLPYTQQGSARVPISDSNDQAIFIKYTLEDALREQALKHLEFELLDTAAAWRERPGAQLVGVDSLLGQEREQRGNALFTALRTEFADQLLAQCVEHWTGYRDRNERSKLLVVAATQPLARRYVAELRRLGTARVDIAISDETPQARANIDRFKKPAADATALDALVTVGMAYEGMDVPSITHLAVLTHIRSLGWVVQMLARAQRVDWDDPQPANQQRGFIFAPRDEFFDDIVGMIRRAQELGRVEDLQPRGPGGTPPPPPAPSVIPDTSDRNQQDVAVDTADRSLSVDRLHYLRDLTQRHGWHGVSLLELDAVLRDDEAARAARAATAASTEAAEAAASARAARAAAPRRPNDEEDELRTAIEQLTAQMDGRQGLEWGTTNTRLRIRFGKSRTEMDLDELREVYDYLTGENDDSTAAVSA